MRAEDAMEVAVTAVEGMVVGEMAAATSREAGVRAAVATAAVAVKEAETVAGAMVEAGLVAEERARRILFTVYLIM